MSCGCDCDGNPVWVGTGLKFAVNMTCPGFDMDSDEWKITVTRGTRRVEFTPENAVQDDNDQWYICFDTAELGPGEVDIIFEAFVPDEDFESGVRREVQKYRLVNIKSV